MLDYEIRESFFDFLEYTGTKIRILEEKQIGRSRCDIFTVTDCLTGYEIKSDSDSYARLKRQVPDYDRHFDKNYIVVGKSHQKGVLSHIPEYWGIYLVDEDGVSLLREAKDNPKLKRLKQLTILWKNELQNILRENKLPKYSSKGKKFIRTKLIEKVDDANLKIAICEQLFERDYTIYDEDEEDDEDIMIFR